MSFSSAPFSSATYHEAVFLLHAEQLQRELLYPEFEALLDGFIPLPEYANGSAKAVYLQINSRKQVVGAVFFLLNFDAKGIVDHRWNVPLLQLLASAGQGPDMGAGAIRLVCYSQCPVAWHQKNLWDPQMTPGQNTFAALKKAVQANRLGFQSSDLHQVRHLTDTEDDEIPTLQPLDTAGLEREQRQAQKQLLQAYSQELRDKLAVMIKQQRLRTATLDSDHQARIQSLQQEHQQRLGAYQRRLEELESVNAELDERNRNLKESLEVQANKIEGMREYFAHKLEAAQSGESSQLQLMQENYALELETRIRAATSELHEMLEMREVELFYRHQNESALKDEIVALKQENQSLWQSTGDQLLSRLAKSGLSFVYFQPGVGQLDVPLDDIGRYLQNPLAYVADKSGVAEALFLAWWNHYQNPCCAAEDEPGHRCNQALTRIGSPLEFHPGESDRCREHQQLSYRALAEAR